MLTYLKAALRYFLKRGFLYEIIFQGRSYNCYHYYAFNACRVHNFLHSNAQVDRQLGSEKPYAIDGSCDPGLFQLISIPNIVGCIGALAVIVGIIATPIARSQAAREVWFYVMSSGITLKIVTVEIARIITSLR